MMKKWVLILLLSAAFPAFGQSYSRYNGYCSQGGTQAQTSGMKSSNYQQSNFPQCTVNVYLHGTTTRATIYSDSSGTPLANPFTAGSNGFYGFYAGSASYDVVMSSPGMATTTIPDIQLGLFPVSISNLFLGSLNSLGIDIMGPPYYAKCDGVTDDHTAIQAAFDAALNSTLLGINADVRLPARTCKTSTITYKGQSVHGQGVGSILLGMPGQDILRSTDNTALSISQYQDVGNFTLRIDNSVDVSGTGVFATRVSGTDTGRPNAGVGSAFAAPWNIGNCGIAFPNSNGSVYGAAFLNAKIHDLVFTNQSGGSNRVNHTCGIFFQSPPYNTQFNNLYFNQIYYGFMTAPPFTNASAQIRSGDTNQWTQFAASSNVPFVWYNGSHGLIDGMSFYGANRNSLGMMLLQYQDAQGVVNDSWSIREPYFEGWDTSVGELQRITGSHYHVFGGSLMQFNPGGYTSWYANGSVVESTLIGAGSTPPVNMYGSRNTFRDIATGSNAATGAIGSFWTDTGFDNRADVYYTSQATAPQSASEPAQRDPIGRQKGDFLMASSYGSPFTSADGLLSVCPEWRFVNGSGASVTCNRDTTVAVSGSYGRWLTASGGFFSQGWWGTPFIFGQRISAQQWKLSVSARSDAAESGVFQLYDITTGTNIGSGCAFAAGVGSFATTTCTYDLSAVVIGNQMGVRLNSLSGSGTYVDFSWFGFSPFSAATSFTTGQVAFGNGTPALAQDPLLFWNNTNKLLGVGVSPVSQTRLTAQGFGTNAAFFSLRAKDGSGNDVINANDAGLVSVRHLGGGNNTAFTNSDAAFGAGAGTSPSNLVLTGNDVFFKVTFTEGTAPVTGTLVQVTYKSSWANPVVVCNAGNSATASLQIYTGGSNSAATLNTNSTPSAGANYVLFCHVGQ